MFFVIILAELADDHKMGHVTPSSRFGRLKAGLMT